MQIESGTRLGPYEIVAPVGAGGMGEVYRARDTRLDRLVAIKVLPAHLSSSPHLRERFEREARAISKLTHPHICTLFDVGRQDGTDFLVMEYLEGETLADRLTRGPLPLRDVLRYGAEIADALDKAHRQGIVHRDLKPGNIMITKSGVKVLDFGLARYTKPEAPSGERGATESPTVHKPLTQEGTILGTIQYMAPEQLEGKDADARTDIFALGAVLYELATGKRAFEGKSKASLIASIMDHDPPPITAIQPMTPPALDRVVRTCLAKDPEDRWQTAHDVRLQLQTISSTEGAAVPSTVRPRRAARELIAWALAVVGVAVAVIALRSHRDGVTAPIRASILPPEGLSLPESVAVALSPDGKYLAYTAPSAAADSVLWIRPIDSLKAFSLAETEGASFPFWSPDSRSIGFFAGGKLNRIAATGGGVQSLCDAPAGRGGSWSATDVIIFAPSVQSRLYRVSASGGECTPLKTTQPSGPVLTHRWPWFLPDGRTFLFYAGSPSARTGIYVSSLDRAEAKFIVDANSRVVYASPAYLLFVREGNLIAQPFDLDKLQLRHKPSVIAERVAVTQGLNYGDFSASSNGIVAFKESGLTTSQALWFDRKGNQLGSVGDPGLIGSIRLSPDGDRVLLTRRDLRTQVGDVWLEEMSRQAPQRITFDNATHIGLAWSPDGKEVIYGKGAAGRPFDVYRLSLLDSGGPKEFLASPTIENPNDWSGDGRYVVLQQVREKTRWDLILARSDQASPPIPWLATSFDEVSAQFSPDGKWIAYASNESGRYEIYVRPFPGPGASIRVSVQGGRAPVWRRDGREIFFLSRDDSLMAVPLTNGSPIQPGPPVRLFPTKVAPSMPGTSSVFEVSRDGQRFLINTRVGPDEPKRINLLLNWASELSERE